MIEAARTLSGRYPADEFLTTLATRRRFSGTGISGIADVVMRFEDLARTGRLEIPRELRELRNEIWELKVGKVRFPFFWLQVPFRSSAIRLTHGFLKNTDKTPRKEIDQAIWIKKEDLAS